MWKEKKKTSESESKAYISIKYFSIIEQNVKAAKKLLNTCQNMQKKDWSLTAVGGKYTCSNRSRIWNFT